MQLYRFVKRSQAWHELSLPARCALIELLDRYNGINNGMIGLGVRTLADALKCSQTTATRALHELDDSGLVTATTVGFWRGKRATEWRLAFYRCDKSGELPNKNWPTRQVHQGSAKGSPRKRCSPSQVHLESTNGEKPNEQNSAQVRLGSTYRIYQGGTGLSKGAPESGTERTGDYDTGIAPLQASSELPKAAERMPDLPAFLDRRTGQ